MDGSGVAAGAEEAASGVEKAFGGLDMAAGGAAAMGLFVAGMNSAMDLSSVESSMQRQLGLTDEEADRAGHIAGDVYSAGFGESMDGVGDAVTQVLSQLGDMNDLTDGDLTALTEQAQALADTFEFDVADSAKMASQMVAQGLAGDATEAFDVLTTAAQTLPRSMLDDLPDIVTEYGTQFQRIGLDGKTAFAMMGQFVKAGGKDLDQAGDVLHEFARITTESTDQASTAFKGLGLNGKAMLADIHAGGPKAAAALGTTIEALRGVKDPAKRAQLQVALFGDMAGEAADALLAMNPQTALAATGMDDTAGAAQGLVDSMAASPAQQWDSVMRTLTTTLGEALLPVLSAVSAFLQEHPALIKAVTPVVLALAVALGIWAAVQWALNSALLANPVTWIILGIVALIAVIVLIATKTTWFQTAWHAMVDGVAAAWNWLWNSVLKPTFAALVVAWHATVDGVSAAWDWLWNGIKAGLSALSSAWTSTMDWIANAVHAGIDKVTGWFLTLAALPGKIIGWFASIGGKIAEPFRAGFGAVARFWNSTIGSFSFSIPSWVPIVGGRTWAMPRIPALAQGGVIPSTPGGMLALVGEGRQDEAVMPLDRLDGMLRTVAGAVRGTGGDGAAARVVIDVTGADSEFKRMISRMVRNQGRGSTQTAFGR
jgi:hypothetical protein